MEKAIQFINDYWPLITAVLGLAEIILRMIPTTKNWSVVDKIYKVLYLIVPNKRKPPVDADGNYEDDFVRNVQGKTVNKIEVPIFRHIIKAVSIIVLASFCQCASGQIWQNFKGVRLVNVVGDTTDVLQVNGSIFYCEDCSPPRFYVYEDNQWKLITGGGSGGGNLSGTLTAPFIPYATGTNTLGNSPTKFSNNTLWSKFNIGSDSVYFDIGAHGASENRGVDIGIYYNGTSELSAQTQIGEQNIDMVVNDINDDQSSSISIIPGSVSLFNYSPVIGVGSSSLYLQGGQMTVSFEYPNSSGISGNEDYSANYGDLSFIQKGWTEDTFMDKTTGVNTYILPGTNVTFDGTGTPADPYIVNATGGGGGGITNGALVREFPVTIDGSGNLDNGGLFRGALLGDIVLGNKATNTEFFKRITATGTQSAVSLLLSGKGAAGSVVTYGNTFEVRDSVASGKLITISASNNLMAFDGDADAEIEHASNSGTTPEFRITGSDASGGVDTDGGPVTIRAGNSTSTGTSGSLTLQSGDDSGSGLVGNVTIKTGDPNGGSAGELLMTAGDGTYLPRVYLYNNLVEITASTSGTQEATIYLDSTGDGRISLETDANGTINIGNALGNNFIIFNIPTSCSGAPTGALWNNSGVLSICP